MACAWWFGVTLGNNKNKETKLRKIEVKTTGKMSFLIIKLVLIFIATKPTLKLDYLNLACFIEVVLGLILDPQAGLRWDDGRHSDPSVGGEESQ